MADNFLEKKYEELRQGRPVIRRTAPSLDSLLSSACARQPEADCGYRVDKAQTEAALASAHRLGIDFEASYSDPALLTLRCRNSYELGAVCTAARLKLAELRLHAELRLSDDGTGAELRIYRPAR